MSETQTPTFHGLLQATVRSLLANVRQCLPGSVVSYDEAARRITAQPLLWESYLDAEGNRQAGPPAQITNVPVLFPGSGKTRVRWPIHTGDTVLLLFASSSLDRWLVTGGSVDPADDRKHDINDCIALPGFLSFPEAGDDSVMVEFTSGGEIHAGGAQKLAFFSELDALRQAYEAHLHIANGLATTGPLGGTIPNPAFNPLNPPSELNPLVLPVPQSSVPMGGTNVLKGG